MEKPTGIDKLNAMEFFLQHCKVDISKKDKLQAVHKYLCSNEKITTRDYLNLGIDPWVWPNHNELYVKRLALIVEELIDSIEQ